MSQLKQGIVIKVPAWKVPVICRKKYLTQPEIAVDVQVGQEDIKAMPDKQFKSFDENFEKKFTPEFQKMSNGWFADMQKTIDTTELAIEKLHKEAELKTPNPSMVEKIKKMIVDMCDKVNKALQAKCKTWTDMVKKLAEKAYEAAYEASLKAMQMKVVKAKAKMIAKVVLFVLLTLTAAAITIAVSVVTMGAGAALAPIVLAGIATAGKAMFGSIGQVVKSYDVLKTTIGNVEADAKKLSESAAASTKAMRVTAGKLDKASAVYKALTADVGALDKHVGQLDKFMAVANATQKKSNAELQKLVDQLAQAKDKSPEAAKLEKQAIEVKRQFEDADANLQAILEIKATAKEAKEAFAKIDPDTILKLCGRFAPVLTKLKTAQATISKYAPIAKEILEGVSKLVK